MTDVGVKELAKRALGWLHRGPSGTKIRDNCQAGTRIRQR